MRAFSTSGANSVLRRSAPADVSTGGTEGAGRAQRARGGEGGGGSAFAMMIARMAHTALVFFCFLTKKHNHGYPKPTLCAADGELAER